MYVLGFLFFSFPMQAQDFTQQWLSNEEESYSAELAEVELSVSLS